MPKSFLTGMSMKKINRESLAILFSIFIGGFSALVYQVLLLIISNIMIGATTFTTSLILSVFLLGLAIGALSGAFIVRKNIQHIYMLILANLIIGLFGLIILFILTRLSLILSSHQLFTLLLFILIIPTIFMGMTIPLGVRLLKFKHATGIVYFSDTLGAVLGALLAGIIIIPMLGYSGSFYLAAMLNLLAIIILILRKLQGINHFGLIVILLLIFLLPNISFQGADLKFFSGIYSIDSLYAQNVLEVRQTPYQNIAIINTHAYGNMLLIDGRLQAAEKDSLKYHEYLTLPAIASHQNPKRVLVLGSGDGGTLHQLLHYNFTEIHHVDIDREVIELSRKYLQGVHYGSLDDPRVNRWYMDARQFLRNAPENYYDLIIIGFPDPYRLELVSLYSVEFYTLVKSALADDGIISIQSGSPVDYLEAQASIFNAVNQVFDYSYVAIVPILTFEHNGFIIASDIDPRKIRNKNAIEGKWYTLDDHELFFKLPSFYRNFFSNNTIPANTDSRPVLHLYLQNQYYQRLTRD